MKALLCALLLLAGCGAPSGSGVKVIVGAKLIRGGQPEIEHSVVVVADGKFRAVGAQSDVPVPKGSEITSGLGKILEPRTPGGAIEPGQPADLLLRDAASLSAEMFMHNGEWGK